MSMLSQWFIEKQKTRLLERKSKYSQIVNDSHYPEFYRKQKNNVGLLYTQKALEKITNRTYGICESCGKDIPKKRLEVVPGAIRCVQCETKEGNIQA